MMSVTALTAIFLRVFLGASLLGAQPMCLVLMGGKMKKAAPAPAKMHADHSCCKKTTTQPTKPTVPGDDPCRQRCDEATKAPTVAPNPDGVSLSVLQWAMVPVVYSPMVIGLDQPVRIEWSLLPDRLGFISLTDLFHQSCLLTL